MSSSVCSVECDGDDEEKMRANNKLSTSCEQNIVHSKNDKDKDDKSNDDGVRDINERCYI